MRRLRGLLVVAMALAGGCGDDDGGAGSSQTDGTPTIASTTIPVATTAASTTVPVVTGSTASTEVPGRVEYGPATYVVGRMKVVMEIGMPTPDPDGTQRFRDVRVSGTTTSTDPRLTGTVEGAWNADAWGTGPEDAALIQWGTSSITTADGRWQGTLTGAYTPEVSDRITWWFIGTGGYEGLSMFMWITESDTYGPLEHAIYALIFPGVPPTP